MPKIEKSGYKRFWELKEYAGVNPDGSKRSIEGYRDMVTGQFHASEKGWLGEPPELPSGERTLNFSDKFKQNYDKILWGLVNS
ncbi:MAG: hypothetical protein Q7J15_08000 [Candidatus Desulfaltia sp.]|nr:hypothetical protein [Candidatus Desulfaltia sp.]